MNKMQIRKIALFVAGLFITNAAFCQSEMLKSVVNNLAYYKQKGDFKYLAGAKKSVDSLVKTHADSVDLQKTVYRGLVNATILYADSTNKLKQPAKLFEETVKLIDWSAKNKKIFRYQVELDFARRCISNVYIRKGFRFLYNSDYNNALQNFRRAQIYTPDFEAINAYIGYVSSKLGNLQDAAKHYADLVKTDSVRVDYIETAANTYELIGDTTKALSIIKHARKLLPDDKILLIHEANIYNNQKDYAKLGGIIKSLLDINPNNADIAYVAGNCYDHLAQYDRAESLYLHAIELNSVAYDPIFNLGVLYLRESSTRNNDRIRNIEYATKWLEKANEISPNDINCLTLLREVYTKTHNDSQLKVIDSKIKELSN